MNTVHPMKETLAKLQEEKGPICISIIVPTHRLLSERKADPLQVEKAVNKAKEYLRLNFSGADTKAMLQSLDELYAGIDFNHNAAGIGLFVSGNIRKTVRFAFPVKEKVIITGSFEIRDLVYQDYYSGAYYVLHLTKKSSVLFQGRLNFLQEINDKAFPLNYEDQYEYSRPVRGSSYVGSAVTKGFEKDKSVLESIRYEDFLRQTDEKLKSYLVNNKPLIIVGAKKDLSHFKQVTQHTRNITGEIEGNYTHNPVNELSALTWNVFKSFLDETKEKLLLEFEEKIGEGYGITGLPEIWKAAREGKGFKLLAEKDFSKPGFLKNEDDYHLHLHPPKEPHRVLPDAVNELIETVLKKNGEVILVENGMLKDQQHAALITRY